MSNRNENGPRENGAARKAPRTHDGRPSFASPPFFLGALQQILGRPFESVYGTSFAARHRAGFG